MFFIMESILISLQRSEHRKRMATSQFSALGLDFKVLDATDWRSLTKADWNLVDLEVRYREGCRPLPQGAVACWLSHRRALLDLVENDPEIKTIFEDDVKLGEKLPQIFDATGKFDWPFDMIFLSKMNQKPFVPLLPLALNYAIGRFRYTDHGALGYVITRSAALRFLIWAPRVIYLIDQALRRYWEHGLNVYTLSPPVIMHGDRGYSLIGESLGATPRPFRYHPMRVMRKIQTLLREEILMRIYFNKQDQ